MRDTIFKPGDSARIRRSIHSPYSGHTGVVMQVNGDDERAPYLVIFNDGLQFRYQAEELEPLGGSPHMVFIGALQRAVHETRHGLWRLLHH